MKVLIIDDSNYMRSTIRNTMEENGYEVVGEAANGEQAIDLGLDLRPDIVTLDNILPDMTGFEVLKAWRKKQFETFVVMISAVGQESSKQQAKELGIDHYLVKPIDHRQLVEIIKQIELT